MEHQPAESDPDEERHENRQQRKPDHQESLITRMPSTSASAHDALSQASRRRRTPRSK
jgi:hypothetical protein